MADVASDSPTEVVDVSFLHLRGGGGGSPRSPTLNVNNETYLSVLVTRRYDPSEFQSQSVIPAFGLVHTARDLNGAVVMSIIDQDQEGGRGAQYWNRPPQTASWGHAGPSTVIRQTDALCACMWQSWYSPLHRLPHPLYLFGSHHVTGRRGVPMLKMTTKVVTSLVIFNQIEQ